MTRSPRVALVHEWLVRWGGSESVLESLARIFPEAPIYTLVYDPDDRVRRTFGHRDIRPTLLQGAGPLRKRYPFLLPLMPWAWRRLRLQGYDLVVSSSHSFAKSVGVEDGLHVCYCHSPPRYLWDLNSEYRTGVSSVLRGPLLAWLRKKDRAGARGVDRFVANSRFVADRIRRVYGADSHVAYPPVDIEAFTPGPGRARDYLLAGGRLVAYKRVGLAVEAATLASLPLVVFGDGPERGRLERIAGPTVRFTGAVDRSELVELFRGASAFVFPGVEDFGILPVEAQATGCPVVALRAGGALETVVEGRTGLFFDEPDPELLARVLQTLDASDYDPGDCVGQARRFRRSKFESDLRTFLGTVT